MKAKQSVYAFVLNFCLALQHLFIWTLFAEHSTQIFLDSIATQNVIVDWWELPINIKL